MSDWFCPRISGTLYLSSRKSYENKFQKKCGSVEILIKGIQTFVKG